MNVISLILQLLLVVGLAAAYLGLDLLMHLLPEELTPEEYRGKEFNWEEERDQFIFLMEKATRNLDFKLKAGAFS